MKKRRKLDGREGVSETIGFIIILGITLTGIGLVTLYGYPALLQEQQNANIKNMEKSMLVLQSDLKTLTTKGVPYQETAIQVSGGTLAISPIPETKFTITENGNPHEFLLGELRFDSSDGTQTVVLENGAVQYRNWNAPGSAMLAKPTWFYDAPTDTYVFTMVTLNASSYMGQTGIGYVKMQLTPPSTPYSFSLGVGDKIWYNQSYENDYHVAWNNYLTSPDLMLNETAPGSGIFTFNDNSNLIIKSYNVTVLSI